MTAIADLTSNCIGYIENPIVPFGPTSFSFSMSVPVANAFDFTANVNGGIFEARIARMYASLTLLAGSTLTVTSDLAEGGGDVTLWLCDGTLIGSQEMGLGPQSYNFSIPSDGTYILRVYYGTTNDWTLTFPVSCDNTMIANPVIALWNDSGISRQLEACPKLLLPPLTEATGSWYADCASAEEMAEYIHDCKLYSDVNLVSTGGQTAYLVGSAFELRQVVDEGCTLGFQGGLLSVNLVGGETITVSAILTCIYQECDEAPPCYTIPGGGEVCDQFSLLAEVRDGTTGAVIDVLNASGQANVQTVGGTFVAPYTGRFIFYTRGDFIAAGPCCLKDIKLEASLSAETAITTNPSQSLYDIGLICPGRLNCGDACP
jgi:hypothetical protein